MGLEYAKSLDSFKDVSKIVVVGRSKESFRKFKFKSNKIHHRFDLDSFLKSMNSSQLAEMKTIVAVQAEHLFQVVKTLLDNGVKDILTEKPGALCEKHLLHLDELCSEWNAEVHIAYNRRFYHSVAEAKEMITIDGGVTSCHFEFTEWSEQIPLSDVTEKTIKNWFLCNSTHVIDTVFHFIGKPVELNLFASKNIGWHEGNTLHVGSGLSSKKIPFSFHSNWDSAGRWKIELYTCHRKIILCPLEELRVVMKNSINEEITKYDIEPFKHGLNNMLTSFLFHDKNNICNLGDQISSWRIYQIMNNEERFNGNHI